MAYLVEDIDRYLNDFPVRARKETFAYLAGKFVRRHRLGVALSAVILLLMASFMVILSMQLRRAELAQQRAERVSGFLRKVFGDTHYLRAEKTSVTALDLLNAAVLNIHDGLTTQPELRLSKPEIVAEFQEKRELIAERYLDGERLPDGRWLALRRSEDEVEPTGTSVVLNWTAELKRRLGN